MNEILEILEDFPGRSRFQLYHGYDQHVARLTVDGAMLAFPVVYYRGEGDTPAAAIEALLADIAAVSPVEIGVVAG